MAGTILTVIVDDENKSIQTLEKLLEKYCPGVRVTGTAQSVREAVEKINTLRPDLVFLDISLPDGDGFDILEKVSFRSFEVIFITASDKYAIKAFGFSAIHYLLKPINYKDLIQAIDRFEHIKGDDLLDSKIKILKDSLNNTHQKIILPSSEGLNIIELDNIIRCEADDNYTFFYLKDGGKLVVSKSLNNFENILSDVHFARIHSKHLINLRYLRKYVKGKAGYVIMHDGTHLYLSEGKKKDFLEKLKEFARSL